MLAALDPLPSRPRRVVVAGTSGSGKSTLARRIGAHLGIPHVDIDGLYHGPGWTPRPSFRADVEEFSARPAWVTEWQYRLARDLLADRADLMVWLDLPRRVVMRRVTVRTVRRRVRREVLWNGNLEPPLRTFLSDPDHIVRWAWDTHHRTAERMAALAVRRPELTVVRLRGPREVRTWTDGPLAAV